MVRNLKGWMASFFALCLSACGGGGGSAGTPVFGGGGDGGTPANVFISLSLSNTTVTAVSPATVTAKVTTTSLTGPAVAGAVVTFTDAGGLGTLSAPSALTDANGLAIVTLSPASANATGADTITASVTYNGNTANQSQGFQLTSSAATFTSINTTGGASQLTPLSAYGQAVVSVTMAGVSGTQPVTVTLSSACTGLGKATISPSTVSNNTTGSFSVTYKDTGGCGATTSPDTITAAVSGASTQTQLPIYLAPPTANSVVFVSASPQQIYLKGSGLQESSTITFQVNDQQSNPLANVPVTLNLTTTTGGLTLVGGTPLVGTTDSLGRVQATVNSGTVPTPVRVTATLASGVSTVSSGLSVGVGLPSQLNFSLSQSTINIEGANYDGTPNTYTVYAADRSGNPVPAGSAITFWAESGQIPTSALTTITNGISSASVSFASQEPRPADGRLTVLAYAAGEESFVDLNGNNTYDAGEPFQDLGNVVKSVLYDQPYDPVHDQYVPIGAAAGTTTCLVTDGSGADLSGLYPLYAENISSIPTNATCNGSWNANTIVRRAVETIYSTSVSNVLWTDKGGLDSSCVPISRQAGSTPDTAITVYPLAGGDHTWYGGSNLSGAVSFVVADANSIRLNPMPAGTTVSVSNPTTNLAVALLGGSPIGSTADVTFAAVSYTFTAPTTTGSFSLTTTSPKGTSTTYVVNVVAGSRPSACP